MLTVARFPCKNAESTCCTQNHMKTSARTFLTTRPLRSSSAFVFTLSLLTCATLLWQPPASRADDLTAEESALLEGALNNLTPVQLRISPGDNPGERKAEWDGEGWVQTADNPAGPWEDVEGGNNSPAILILDEVGRFVRLHRESV